MKNIALKYKKHYWIKEQIIEALKNIPSITLLDMMPKGDTTESYAFTMYPHNGKYWEMQVRDWWGDRSSIKIIEHQTSEYTSLDDAIYYTFRDFITFLSDRKCLDEYTINLFNKIMDLCPELKKEKWYNVEEN